MSDGALQCLVTFASAEGAELEVMIAEVTCRVLAAFSMLCDSQPASRRKGIATEACEVHLAVFVSNQPLLSADDEVWN